MEYEERERLVRLEEAREGVAWRFDDGHACEIERGIHQHGHAHEGKEGGDERVVDGRVGLAHGLQPC